MEGIKTQKSACPSKDACRRSNKIINALYTYVRIVLDVHVVGFD